MEQILRVNVQTEQILRVNVLKDHTPRARTVRTDQTHLVNVLTEQINHASVLMYVMISFVSSVILTRVNVLAFLIANVQTDQIPHVNAQMDQMRLAKEINAQMEQIPHVNV